MRSTCIWKCVVRGDGHGSRKLILIQYGQLVDGALLRLVWPDTVQCYLAGKLTRPLYTLYCGSVIWYTVYASVVD